MNDLDDLLLDFRRRHHEHRVLRRVRHDAASADECADFLRRSARALTSARALPRERELVLLLVLALIEDRRIVCGTNTSIETVGETLDAFLRQAQAATFRAALRKQRVENLAEFHRARMLERHVDWKTRGKGLIEILNPAIEPIEVFRRLRNHDEAIRVWVCLDREDAFHSRGWRSVANSTATLEYLATRERAVLRVVA